MFIYAPAVLVLIGEVSLEIIAGAKLLASLRASHDQNAVVAPAEGLVQNEPATYISPLIRDTEWAWEARARNS
jgi:hypothetical protein